MVTVINRPGLRVADLAPDQVVLARQLIIKSKIEQIHPFDKPLINDAQYRAVLAQRYRRTIIENTENLAVFDGHDVIAVALYGDGQNPITQQKERHILDLAAKNAVALSQLLTSLLDVAYREKVDLLRLEIAPHNPAEWVAETVRSLGFQIQHLILRRAVSATPTQVDGGRFEITSSRYREFAYHCIIQGISNSFPPNQPDIKEKVTDYVHQTYNRLRTSHRQSVVALTEDGQPRAHAWFELMPAQWSPKKECNLIDIFVLPQYKGEGWSVKTWQYLEGLLSKQGIERAEGTLFVEGKLPPSQLLSSLERNGWWVERHSLKYLLA